MTTAANDWEAAALAVEQTMPPAVRVRWADRVMHHEIVDLMADSTRAEGIPQWWAAASSNVIRAVQHMTGLDEGTVSVIVGATVHGMWLAGLDRTQAVATERATMAAFWHAGRRWGNTEAAMQAPATGVDA